MPRRSPQKGAADARELKQLRDWKESAMKELGKWDRVRKLIPCNAETWGQALQDVVCERLAADARRIAELERERNFNFDKYKRWQQKALSASTLIAEVRETLPSIEAIFREYARIHYAKGTSEGNRKAIANEGHANTIAALLAKMEAK